MDILKIIPINLDLKRVMAQASPIPTLVEGDTGNKFVITLTDSGEPVDLRPYTVHVVFSHPDGTISERTSAVLPDPSAPPPILITGADNNVIEFVLMDYNLFEGKNNCEIVIRGDTYVTTAQFNFDCRKAILSGGTPEQQEKLPTLMGLIDQASEAVEIATEAAGQVQGVVEGEAARQAAETARQAAEIVREEKTDEIYTAYTSGAFKGEKGDRGDPGAGFPAGGDAGQVLVKRSGADYDTEWATEAVMTTATLSASAWTGDAAPYTYTIPVGGVTANNTVEVLPGFGISLEQLEALQAANLQDGGQTTGQITLKAFGDKPAAEIPVRFIVRRGL